MKNYYIKERYNPQLGTYYVRCGQLSKTEAKRQGNALYGDNVMHPYETEAEYLSALEKLKNEGASVRP